MAFFSVDCKSSFVVVDVFCDENALAVLEVSTLRVVRVLDEMLESSEDDEDVLLKEAFPGCTL